MRFGGCIMALTMVVTGCAGGTDTTAPSATNSTTSTATTAPSSSTSTAPPTTTTTVPPTTVAPTATLGPEGELFVVDLAFIYERLYDPRTPDQVFECMTGHILESWEMEDLIASVRDALVDDEGASTFLRFSLVLQGAESECDLTYPPFPGDDPALDELLDECVSGEIASCGALMYTNLFWSEVVAIAGRCGDTSPDAIPCATSRLFTDEALARYDEWLATHADG